MNRCVGLAAWLLLLGLLGATLGAQGAPAPSPHQSLLERLGREVSNDPAVLEKALRDRLAAAGDAETRRELTSALAQFLAARVERYPEAADVLREAEQWAPPADIEAMALEIVEQAWRNDFLGKMLRAIEESSKAHPQSRALWVLIAQGSARNRDYPRAVEAWQRAQQTGPTPSGSLNLAAALRGAERYEEALAAAQQAGELSVSDRVFAIGYPLTDLGRKDEALKLADELAASPALTSAELRAIARLYARCEAHAQRIPILKRALELSPDDAEDQAATRRDLGGAYEDTGDMVSAFREMQLSAIGGERAAQNWLARYAADTLDEPERFSEAIEACFADWMPGAEALAGHTFTRWFEPWTMLSENARIIVDAADRGHKLPQLLSAAQQGLAQHPGSTAHLSVLIAARAKSGDLAGAADAARLLHEARPEAMPADRVAAAFAEAGNTQAAVEWFGKSPPGEWLAESFRWAGTCHAAAGEAAKVDEIAAALRAPHPPGPGSTSTVVLPETGTAFREGLLRLGAGQFDRAIALLEESPRFYETKTLDRDLARAYAEVGRTDDAVTAFERSLKTAGMDYWLEDATALARLMSARLPPADYVVRLAAILRENRPAQGPLAKGVWTAVVEAESQADRLPQLTQALGEAAKAPGDDPWLWAALALAQMKGGDPKAAQASFEAAGRLNSAMGLVFRDEYQLTVSKNRAPAPGVSPQQAWEDYQRNFGPALQGGDMDRAAEIACNLVAGFSGAQPDQRDQVLQNVAMSAKAAKPYEAFIAAVAIRAEQDPDNPGPTLLLAHCCYQAKQYDRVAETLTNAPKALEKDASAWVLLGKAQRDQGLWQEAADAWRKALELEPDTQCRKTAEKLLEEAKGRGF